MRFKIFSSAMAFLLYSDPSGAVLEEYKDLLAHEEAPYLGTASSHVSIKLKALIAAPQEVDLQGTLLRQYYSFSNIPTSTVTMMRTPQNDWKFPDDIRARRFALCRDLFSQVGGRRCESVDIFHLGYFPFDPFKGDVAPGAAVKAAEELRDLRNVLLRQGLFQTEVSSVGFTYHHIGSEAVSFSAREPSDLLDEWKGWTSGVGSSGGGGGQTYGSLKYDLPLTSQKKQFFQAIKLEKPAGGISLATALQSKFEPYTYVFEKVNIEQFNDLIKKINEIASKISLEVLELELNYKDITYQDWNRIDRHILRSLTGNHGVFVKVNLPDPGQQLEFWKNILRGGDNYYQYKVILSSPGESSEPFTITSDRPGFSGPSDSFKEMRKRFYLVYGN